MSLKRIPFDGFAKGLTGFLLAAALGAVGTWLAAWLGRAVWGLEKSPVSPVMVSIVLGMAIGNVVRLPAWTRPGLRFAMTRVLRLGIVLLGIRLSFVEVARLGALAFPLVVLCILSGLLLTGALGRRFGLPPRLVALIGVGTSICGVSAIAATGPAIRARDEEVAYAIAVITVFGLVAMLVYPYLSHALFAADPTSVGLFLGTAVHDTSQVNGAAMIYADVHGDPRALDVAIVTKLVRNLFMIAVIPVMALRHHRSEGTGDASTPRVPLLRLFPAFVLGFVLMAVLRSVGDAGLRDGLALGLWDAATWSRLHGLVRDASLVCMVVALSAVGLGTDFRAFRSLRLAPFVVGLGSALAVGVVSYVGIRLLAQWTPGLPAAF